METRELESAPALPPLYAKAALGPLLPGARDELPDHALALRGVEVDPEHLADYSRVCGFPLRDSLPVTYPHVLGFPLQMALMSERSFPFPLLGMVHIANRIEQPSALPRDAALDLRVWAEDLRAHRRGRQFDVVTEVAIDGEVGWREQSTYLRREGGDGEGDGDKQSQPGAAGERPGDEASGDDASGGSTDDLATSAIWKVPGDIGRRYAGVSGDRNPIHLHSLSGKAFGFPGAIAHGMWTLARCLASFEGRVGPAQVVGADFRAPLVIPGRARLRVGGDPLRFVLESVDGKRRHLEGDVSEPT